MLSRTLTLSCKPTLLSLNRSLCMKRCLRTSRLSAFSTRSPMFEHQSKLPKLPIPALKDTLERYLVGLEPLVSAEQLERTRKVVAEFESNSSFGPYLQEELLKLDQLTTTSYIEGFWDSMYLEIRDPIVTNVNPGFVFSFDDKKTFLAQLALQLDCSLQIAQTSQLLEASARYVQLVRNEQLSPDMEKTTPLDMSQYPKLFSSTRIPGYNRDILQHQPDHNAKHILLIDQGQYFKVDILDQDGNALKINQIAAQLVNAHQQASQHKFEKHAFYPLGPFTAQDRLNWSWNYAHLASLGKNRESLNLLEESLFAVCLDDSVPASVNEAGLTILHGASCNNRYYDKSIQLIVFQDGRTGINFEHTGFDGHTILSFVNAIHSHQANLEQCHHVKMIQNDVPRITFTLDEKLRRNIDAAKTDFADRAAAISGAYLDFKTHGKKFITSHGLSPDAYVQMAFQLTQFRLFNKLVSTYESSNVKHFNHGRTECVRSATSDAKKFVETFDDAGKSPETKMAALTAAVERHVVEMKKSKEGKLVDRHLQALNWLSMQQAQRQAGYKRPTLFTDPSYGTHFASILSTSNCGSPALDHFSFGPVTASGLGIGYMIKDHNIPVAITSFQGQANSFANGLSKSLQDMHAFVSQHGKKKL